MVIWILILVWFILVTINETSAQTKEINTCKMIETVEWKVYIKADKEVYCVAVPFNS